MTTARTYADDEGTFEEWRPASRRCPRCNGPVQYRVWESSDGGYEDEQYQCEQCGHIWWVDGPDS